MCAKNQIYTSHHITVPILKSTGPKSLETKAKILTTTWKVQHDLAPFKPHLWPSFPLSFSSSHNHLLLLKHTWHVPASETLHALGSCLEHDSQIYEADSFPPSDLCSSVTWSGGLSWQETATFSLALLFPSSLFLHTISDTPWFPFLSMCCLSPFPSSTESPEKTCLLGSFCLGQSEHPRNQHPECASVLQGREGGCLGPGEEGWLQKSFGKRNYDCSQYFLRNCHIKHWNCNILLFQHYSDIIEIQNSVSLSAIPTL